jgi:hypothetical protein
VRTYDATSHQTHIETPEPTREKSVTNRSSARTLDTSNSRDNNGDSSHASTSAPKETETSSGGRPYGASLSDSDDAAGRRARLLDALGPVLDDKNIAHPTVPTPGEVGSSRTPRQVPPQKPAPTGPLPPTPDGNKGVRLTAGRPLPPQKPAPTGPLPPTPDSNKGARLAAGRPLPPQRPAPTGPLPPEPNANGGRSSAPTRPLPPTPNANAGPAPAPVGPAKTSGRSTKEDKKNDLDKAFKEAAENNNEHAHVDDGNSEADDVFNDQTGITNPDDDRGRRLYQKASFKQVSKTEQKKKRLNAGRVGLGTLTGKGDIRTNERLFRKYAGDTTNIGLSEDLKIGNRESVEENQSSYAGFAGAQLQHNFAAARYEGNIDKGPVRVKPKAEVLAGVNGQLEAQAQVGRNPNVQLDGQLFAGARVDSEVGIEVFNKKLGKPEATSAATGTAGSASSEEPKRLLKLKARADASVGAQANVSALAGRAQKNGQTITGAGASVDLFAGARARGKLTAEAAGVGVAAQVEALAGVGITATAGLKKQGSEYKLTHGFGASVGVGASVLHEVTFNPALAKEAISGVIPKLEKTRGRALTEAGLREPGPNKLRKPRPQPASFVNF